MTITVKPTQITGALFQQVADEANQFLRQRLNEVVKEIGDEMAHGITPEMLFDSGWLLSHNAPFLAVWTYGKALRLWQDARHGTQLQWLNGGTWNVFPNSPTLAQLRAVVELTREQD